MKKYLILTFLMSILPAITFASTTYDNACKKATPGYHASALVQSGASSFTQSFVKIVSDKQKQLIFVVNQENPKQKGEYIKSEVRVYNCEDQKTTMLHTVDRILDTMSNEYNGDSILDIVYADKDNLMYAANAPMGHQYQLGIYDRTTKKIMMIQWGYANIATVRTSKTSWLVTTIDKKHYQIDKKTGRIR